MNDRDISKVIHLIEKEVAKWELPIVSSLAEEHSGPFPILISTILSLRTKDEVTAIAAERLLALARTP
jgi:endonuclease-3